MTDTPKIHKTTALQAYAEKEGTTFRITLKIIKDLHNITTKSFRLDKEKSSFRALVDELYPLGSPQTHPAYVTKKEFQTDFIEWTLEQNPALIPAGVLTAQYDKLFRLTEEEAEEYIDKNWEPLIQEQTNKISTLLQTIKEKNQKLLNQYKKSLSTTQEDPDDVKEKAKWAEEVKKDPDLPPPIVSDAGGDDPGLAVNEAPPEMPIRTDTNDIAAQANFDSSIMGDSVSPLPSIPGRQPVRQLKGLAQKEVGLLTNLPSELKVKLHGIGFDRLIEPVPGLLRYPGDAVLQGENNASIQCSRDLIYGLKAHTGAGAIAISAGRSGRQMEDKKNGKKNPAENTSLKKPIDLVKDAAYIYVSQKSDSATLLKVAGGTYAKKVSTDDAEKIPRAGLSLVAMKADDIVIMSREAGIRLMTGVDQFNSKGEPLYSKFGIDLIAGNDDSAKALQPLVLGNSLEVYLKTLSEIIDDVRKVLYSFISSQLELNASIAQHTHYDPFSIFLGTMATGNPSQLNGGQSYLSQSVFDAGAKAMLANAQQQNNLITVMRKRRNNDFNAFNKVGGYRVKSPKNRTN